MGTSTPDPPAARGGGDPNAPFQIMSAEKMIIARLRAWKRNWRLLPHSLVVVEAVAAAVRGWWRRRCGGGGDGGGGGSGGGGSGGGGGWWWWKRGESAIMMSKH